MMGIRTINRSACAVVLASALAMSASAQTRVYLPNRGASYEVFQPAAGVKNTGAGIIVCPGGGYVTLTRSTEGYPTAQHLNDRGITAFVLTYRVGFPHPYPLSDFQQAIRSIRRHAADFGIDPNRLGVMGFSAGGHLAATACSYYDLGTPGSTDSLLPQSSRPDFSVLIYPVISMEAGITNTTTRNIIIGTNPTQAMIDSLSLNLHVNANTPRSFLTHGDADRMVPIQNSRLYYNAMLANNLPTKLHIEPGKDHGYPPDIYVGTTWFDSSMAWVERQGFLTPSTPVLDQSTQRAMRQDQGAAAHLTLPNAGSALRSVKQPRYDLSGRLDTRPESPLPTVRKGTR